MNWLHDLFTNPYLLASLSSWFLAQVAKTIINAFVTKSWDFTRLIGDGGMPSGHSATVSSLAVMCAMIQGVDSFAFALSFILAVIVCHDAMGVRLETEKQAQLINEIVKSFRVLTTNELPEVKLKEFVGHTPIQVLAGIALGILNALMVYYFMF